MEVKKILEQIDVEIAQLRYVRALLAGKPVPAAKRNTAAEPAAMKTAKKRKKKRNLSPQGRKRIAEAVRRRWAEQKKASAAS